MRVEYLAKKRRLRAIVLTEDNRWAARAEGLLFSWEVSRPMSCPAVRRDRVVNKLSSLGSCFAAITPPAAAALTR